MCSSTESISEDRTSEARNRPENVSVSGARGEISRLTVLMFVLMTVAVTTAPTVGGVGGALPVSSVAKGEEDDVTVCWFCARVCMRVCVCE